MSERIPPVIAPPPELSGATAIPTGPLPVPPAARIIGLAALLLALVLVITALLGWLRYPDLRGLTTTVAVAASVGALLLTLGGGAFLFGARMGRFPLWLWIWTAWPIVAGLMLATAANTAEVNGATSLFTLYAGVGIVVALFALALGWSLLTGPVAAWLSGPVTPAPAGTVSRRSILALLSLIFAFSPPWLLLNSASLVLGILALDRIRRAGGTLHGRGMAWTGIIVSSIIFMVAFGSIGISAYFVASNPQADERIAVASLRALIVAQRVDQQLHSQSVTTPIPTNLADWLAQLPADGAPGPLTAAELTALAAADVGKHGANAVPYGGYVFRMDPPATEEIGGARWHWRFSACPRQRGRASAWQVEENAEPWSVWMPYEQWLRQ
jgi:hypothetical protein